MIVFDACKRFIPHQYCPAVLQALALFMCSTRCTSSPLTLRCAAAPAKTSPAHLPMKTGLQIFLLYGLHIHVPFDPPFFVFVFFFLSQQDDYRMFLCAGGEFLGGELYSLRLCGNSSGSRGTCLWGCLPTF